jgi:hypothetical protein
MPLVLIGVVKYVGLDIGRKERDGRTAQTSFA